MESVKDLEESLLIKLDLNPIDISILNKLGYIYLHSNNFHKSEEFYLRSVFIEKDQFEPYVSLGLICTITGRLGRALYFLFKSKEKNPDSEELLKSIEEINIAITNREGNLSQNELNTILEQAYHSLELPNIEEALELNLKTECLYPEDETILLNIAILFLRNSDVNLAQEYLNKLINKSNNPMAHHYLGIISNLNKEYDKAFEYIHKSLELKPTLADSLGNGKYAFYKKEYSEEKLEKCPSCGEIKLLPENILNQSTNSFNFNIINPLRIWDKCQNCNLVFANPRPDSLAMKKYEFELSLNVSKVLASDMERLVLESNAYNERLNIIDKFISRKHNCLDMKSDYGVFAFVAKNRGWNITCIESNYFKTEKIKKAGLTFYPSIKELDESHSYDLITLWENIEKIADFKQTIEKAYDLLSDDGVFAISFHGKNSYMSHHLGKDYPVWSYPDYLYFFDIEIIKKELEKNGFKIVETQIISRKYLSNIEIYAIKSE